MSISSLYLDAFHMVALKRSFSKAAKSLNLSQPALSQRILNLEDELKILLIKREINNIELTNEGKILWQYYKAKQMLENEALTKLHNLKTELIGDIAISSFSTFMRSLLLKKISQIVRKNKDLSISLFCLEVDDLAKSLTSGQAKFCFTTIPILDERFVNKKIGYEENIMIESAKYKTNHKIFIDHDINDKTTLDFFLSQFKRAPKIRRIFFDEIYSIIDGVKEGLGRAIVPRHLVINDKNIKHINKDKVLSVPVYFCYEQKKIYSKAEEYLIHKLIKWRPFD